MSIRATGTEGTIPKYVTEKKEKKINIKPGETILSFAEKYPQGEILKINESSVSIKDKPLMKDCVESLPKEMRDRLTPEMRDDIKKGISVSEFVKKYAKDFGEKYPQGEILKINESPVSIKGNPSMKDRVEFLPKEMRDRLTPEMRDDNKKGISVSEFVNKYAKELAQNMGI